MTGLAAENVQLLYNVLSLLEARFAGGQTAACIHAVCMHTYNTCKKASRLAPDGVGPPAVAPGCRDELAGVALGQLPLPHERLDVLHTDLIIPVHVQFAEEFPPCRPSTMNWKLAYSVERRHP